MEGRTNRIEGVLRRIEEHIERWRAEKQAREQEVEADRDALWAEAVEREELLAETIEGEESRGRSVGERASCPDGSGGRRLRSERWIGGLMAHFRVTPHQGHKSSCQRRPSLLASRAALRKRASLVR
jgi:hypothetical protein